MAKIEMICKECGSKCYCLKEDCEGYDEDLCKNPCNGCVECADKE